jgi:hypothetical protein
MRELTTTVVALSSRLVGAVTGLVIRVAARVTGTGGVVGVHDVGRVSVNGQVSDILGG